MAARGEEKILPHGELEQLAPNLWSVTGSLPFPLRRNMTVARLADGTLLLHSVLKMTDEGMAKLEALGRPAVLIVPSTGHRMDAAFYKRRYPTIRVLAPAAVRAKAEEMVAVDATCEEALPGLGVRVHAVPGLKSGESAYEIALPEGRALVLCDALANPDHPPGFGGLMMAAVAGGVRGRLGMPRLVRMLLLKDRAAAKTALAGLAEIPDVRVVTVAHGRPVVGGCAEAIREAVAAL